MFAYGLLAVVIALRLKSAGFDDGTIGALFAFTLAGDTLVSLYLTTRADWYGRRLTLVVGSLLMILASVVFAVSNNFWVLVAAATIGVLSPSGNEIGPFLPVEQAALSDSLDKKQRVTILAAYNFAGYLAAAFGMFAGGKGAEYLQKSGWSAFQSYQAILIVHAAIGFGLIVLYLLLPKSVEIEKREAPRLDLLGLDKSRNIVLKLSALFALDAFAGGFVMQSLIAYWFHLRWEVDLGQIGLVMMFGNIFAGISALLAGRLAEKFGLVNTMVWTHVPSNVLLILVPLMPNFPLAIACLLARFCLSQMDVPTRQAYVLAVVDPHEKSAAGGVTNVARSVGVTLSPLLLGPMMARPVLGLPLIIAGVLKIVYDLSLLVMCRRSNAIQ